MPKAFESNGSFDLYDHSCCGSEYYGGGSSNWNYRATILNIAEVDRVTGIIALRFRITAALRVGRCGRSSRTSSVPAADGSGLWLPLDGEDTVIGESRTRSRQAYSTAIPPPPPQFSISSQNNSGRKETRATTTPFPP